MSDQKFGVQYSPLSGQIQIGRVNKAGTEFTEHEYQTYPVVFAVAEYVEQQREGAMYIAYGGRRYEIDVKLVSDE